MDDALKCCVHYPRLETKKCNLKPISSAKFVTLSRAKEARCKLGGENLHYDQCCSLPSTFEETKYHVHDPCYKKFTMANSIASKRNSETKSEGSRSKRLATGRILFPPICQHPDCLSADVIKFDGQREKPNNLATKKACQNLLEAAEFRKDEDMLTKIRGEDLIAREFKMHRRHFRDYTRVVSTNRRSSEPEKEPSRTRTDPDSLKQFVKSQVIEKNQSVSMRLLTEIYGFDPYDCRYRGKVKDKLDTELFPDELCFVSVSYHDAQVVISRATFTNLNAKSFIADNDEVVLDRAAEILRESISQKVQTAKPLPWPPSLESIQNPDRIPPEEVVGFILKILHDSRANHKKPGVEVRRVADSIAQDLIFNYSRGSFITPKHAILGLALHSMTGLKIPLMILGSLGHIIKYDEIRAIEAANAELAARMIDRGYQLPLIPGSEDESVLTYFWWDNYDQKKEDLAGGIHTTHGVGFQEPGPGAVARPACDEEVGKSRTYKAKQRTLPQCKLNPHKNPPLIPHVDNVVSNPSDTGDRELFYWKVLRQHYGLGNGQKIPRYVGHVIDRFSDPMRPKTILTFLPPIMNPITEYPTVLECIVQSQQMAVQSNMKYVHIYADVGAAAKFYHVVWNNPVPFKNVIILLGDFHLFNENFGVAGKFVEGSGFEDILFQSGNIKSGTIRGAMTGKHYNKAWEIHEAFSEAVHRFFMETHMSSEIILLNEFMDSLPSGIDRQQALFESGNLASFYNKYSAKKQDCLKGEFGLTAKFWMMYDDHIQRLQKLHFAINTNNFDLRLQCWEDSLPYFFTMNKVNYARYGSYYCHLLRNIDQTHPGAKDELKTGTSVCRNNDGIGQSVDGSGEQTFMKNSKTIGGIRNFSQTIDTYEKWVLTRPFAAEMVDAVLQMVDMDSQNKNPRICLRASQILKSEEMVSNIVTTINDNYIVPHDRTLDPLQLVNIVSGAPLEKEDTECLLTAYERGITLMNVFSGRIYEFNSSDTTKGNFFDTVKRQPWKSFANSAKMCSVKSKNGRVKDISVQRDILGILAAKSAELEKPIDFRQCLKYSLCPVPLSLATTDGRRRKTTKSKLMSVLNIGSIDEVTDAIYFIDVIAQIRTMTKVPETFRLLAHKLLNDINPRYKIVYFVCDRYDVESIKQAEQQDRGTSRVYNIQKADMKIPDMSDFMKNGQNKDKMLELIENVMIQERSLLGDRILYFARGPSCIFISSTDSKPEHELHTNHIEADTKLYYLILHAYKLFGNRNYLVRSPSGDIDIPVILLTEIDVNIFIDNGRGISRITLNLGDCELSYLQRKAMVGFHAFTGNDFNSSFFYKTKVGLWTKIKDDQEALEILSKLGNSASVTENFLKDISSLVCTFYGQSAKTKDVNEARYNIFWKSYQKNKIIDLSFLPPCMTSLAFHTKRANTVSRLWKDAKRPMYTDMNMDGWNNLLEPIWVEKPFPDSIEDLLITIPDDSDVALEYADVSDDEF